MSPSSRTFASFYHGSRDEHLTFGDMIAGRELIRAVLDYSTMDRYRLPAESALCSGDARLLRQRLKRKGGAHSLELAAFTNPRTDFQPDPAVFHDAWRHDYSTPFYIRSTYGRRPYPVTITNHSAFLPVDFAFIPLLSPAVQPYDSVICTTPSAAKAYRHRLRNVAERFEKEFGAKPRCRGRIDCIPLGVDVERFRPRNKAAARANAGIGANAFVMLWLGRVSAATKADLLPLLHVLQNLVQANPSRDVLFVIAGSSEGNYGSHVRGYAKTLGLERHVRFMDASPATAHLTFALADVFVSPSDNIQESFGLTVIEAMASGVPQVVSAWDGYADNVEHGVTGFLVRTSWGIRDDEFSQDAFLREKIGLHPWRDQLIPAQQVAVDLGAYQQYLQLLMDNKELRLRMAAESRRHAVSQFSWRRIIGEYDALWSELIAIRNRTKRSSLPASPQAYRNRWDLTPFEHFAAHRIAEDDRITLTSRGRLVDASGLAPCLSFDPGLAIAALSILRTNRDRRRTLRELMDRLAARASLSRYMAGRVALWLLKYGYIELA